MDVKRHVHQAMDRHQLPVIYQLLYHSLLSATTLSAETTLRIHHHLAALDNAVSYAVVTLHLQDISTEMWEYFFVVIEPYRLLLEETRRFINGQPPIHLMHLPTLFLNDAASGAQQESDATTTMSSQDGDESGGGVDISLRSGGGGGGDLGSGGGGDGGGRSDGGGGDVDRRVAHKASTKNHHRPLHLDLLATHLESNSNDNQERKESLLERIERKIKEIMKLDEEMNFRFTMKKSELEEATENELDDIFEAMMDGDSEKIGNIMIKIKEEMNEFMLTMERKGKERSGVK